MKLNVKMIGIFFRKASKILHELNGHLEMFSFSSPQVLENSRQYLLLTVVGCPCNLNTCIHDCGIA